MAIVHTSSAQFENDYTITEARWRTSKLVEIAMDFKNLVFALEKIS